MTNLIEKVRQYSVANGGHATVAASAGISQAHFVGVVTGRVVMTKQFAAIMAPLVGISAAALMREDADYHFATRKGSAS